VLKVRGKGGKVVLVPLPPAVAHAVDRAVDGRDDGPIPSNTLGARMDRHAGTRRLKHPAEVAGIRMLPMHPPAHAATPRAELAEIEGRPVTTMLDAGARLYR
jgi:integrase/recombinase XerD